MENLPSPTDWAVPFFVITVALENHQRALVAAGRSEDRDGFRGITDEAVLALQCVKDYNMPPAPTSNVITDMAREEVRVYGNEYRTRTRLERNVFLTRTVPCPDCGWEVVPGQQRCWREQCNVMLTEHAVEQAKGKCGGIALMIEFDSQLPSYSKFKTKRGITALDDGSHQVEKKSQWL